MLLNVYEIHCSWINKTIKRKTSSLYSYEYWLQAFFEHSLLRTIFLFYFQFLHSSDALFCIGSWKNIQWKLCQQKVAQQCKAKPETTQKKAATVITPHPALSIPYSNATDKIFVQKSGPTNTTATEVESTTGSSGNLKNPFCSQVIHRGKALRRCNFPER